MCVVCTVGTRDLLKPRKYTTSYLISLDLKYLFEIKCQVIFEFLIF